MALSDVKPIWSFAALGWWLARCSLLGVFMTALLFGPEMANFAWEHAVHVTPDQAALHYLLMAKDVSHHHQHSSATPPANFIGRAAALVQTGQEMIGFQSYWGHAALAAVPTPEEFETWARVLPEPFQCLCPSITPATPPPRLPLD